MKKTELKNTFDIDAVCDAAHVYLTKEEKEGLVADIQLTLDYFREVDGDCSKCTAERESVGLCALRADEPSSLFSRDEMIDAAHEKERGAPFVPRVVEGGKP